LVSDIVLVAEVQFVGRVAAERATDALDAITCRPCAASA